MVSKILISFILIFSCAENYLGDYCQYENPCFAGGRKCQNGGSCRVLESADRVPTFKCECPIGYTASFCEIEVSRWLSHFIGYSI